MNFDTSATVRQLAVEIPGATRIFEQFKIDYCCGGGKTLAEASVAVGADTVEIQRLLADASTKRDASGEIVDFATMSLSRLIEHIVTGHHIFTRAELDRLDALVEKVCQAHGQNHPELLRIRTLVTELGNDLRPHMLKEERVLFPYIKNLEESANSHMQLPLPPFGTVRNPVRMMTLEHEAAGEILQRIRDESQGFVAPPEACFSYLTLYTALEALEKDLHQHIHLENNVLFPRAVELEGAAGSK